MFDLVEGGSEDEVTVRRNRDAFVWSTLVPRVLVDVSSPDPSVTVVGERLEMPVLLAPTGVAEACHPGGDLLAARAAARFGTVFVAGMYTAFRMEDIAEAARGPLW